MKRALFVKLTLIVFVMTLLAMHAQYAYAGIWNPMSSGTGGLHSIWGSSGKEIDCSGTTQPLPTVSYSDLDQTGYAGTIIGGITVSNAEEVRDVTDFGAVGDGETDNTAAIQAALDYFKTTGGTITMYVPGTYIISDHLIIYSNETLEGASGVVLARKPLASPKQAYTCCPNVIANYSATIENNTDDVTLYDHDIVIRNITISDTLDSSLGCGQGGAPHVWSRGLIELNNIKNALVENYTAYTPNEKVFYSLDLQSATYSNLKNITIYGNNTDGIHCTGGTHDILIDTFDINVVGGDNIALNADDYPVDTGREKDIYNVAIRNGVVRSIEGSIPLILTGSWADWASGNHYSRGNVCVSNGKLYKVYNNILVVESITAPSHSPGDPGTTGIGLTCKTYDSGVNAITWAFVGPGSNTEANVYNITMDNVITIGPGASPGAYTQIGTCMAAGYDYGVYIDAAKGINTTGNSYVNNVYISNCARWNGSTWGPAMIRQYYNDPVNGALNTQTLIIIDSDVDVDGIPNNEDNCPNKPNGPNLGTCMSASAKPGITCYSDADCAIGCSTNGKCSLNQEDADGDGVGDVCDVTPITTTIVASTTTTVIVTTSTTSTLPTTTTNSVQPTTTTTMITTTTALSIPSAPSNLTATAISSSQINLSWMDKSENESGFKIERATSSSGLVEIAIVGTNVKSYSDTGLNRSTKYYYQVRAYNAAGNSGYSNIASATTHRR